MVWGLSSPASPASPLTGAPNPSSSHVATASAATDGMTRLVVDGVVAKTITLESPRAYKPKAAPGTFDDYHCTLINPHIQTNSYIVASQFFPGSKEIHHSILFLVPPNLAAAAERSDKDGNGWSCFGEAPIPSTSADQISNTPWLTAWGPGAPENIEPAGTGVPLPAGSLVIEQIHYNLLIGDKPVRAKLELQTVPETTALKASSLGLYAAPPDIPCQSGVHGPLCNRAASLAYTAKEFGQSQVAFINLLEQICGRNPVDPPSGDTTSCTWPVMQYGSVVRVRRPHAPLGRIDAGRAQPGDATSRSPVERRALRLQLPTVLQLEDAGCSHAVRQDPGELYLQPAAPPGDPLHA